MLKKALASTGLIAVTTLSLTACSNDSISEPSSTPSESTQRTSESTSSSSKSKGAVPEGQYILQNVSDAGITSASGYMYIEVQGDTCNMHVETGEQDDTSGLTPKDFDCHFYEKDKVFTSELFSYNTHTSTYHYQVKGKDLIITAEGDDGELRFSRG